MARVSVVVLLLALAGCAAESPALAPEDERRDPYFLDRGFMGGFENRVWLAPPASPPEPSSPAPTRSASGPVW